MSSKTEYSCQRQLRFISAASLFDGHDVAINIMRRILQSSGAEVVHLGHNRSVTEIVTAAIQEDVHGIALSSYQGGHVEYLQYMVDQLRERGAGHIKIFAGGGGVILPNEIEHLENYGVCRIYSPQDGQKLGLQGIINDMLKRSDVDLCESVPETLSLETLPRIITALQESRFTGEIKKPAKPTPILGITGTGGAGKSSLTDELIQRFRLDNPEAKLAVIAVDPTRRKTGGALLGDRIRMNAIEGNGVFFRSLATRQGREAIPESLTQIIQCCQSLAFDLIIIETPGIGQGDAGIVPYVDHALYVMTPEFGAATQLEKIDMLDYADWVAINKFDRKGAEDAQRDVAKQMQRNRQAFDQPPQNMPVYGTMASRFNDTGVTALYHALIEKFNEKTPGSWATKLDKPQEKSSRLGQALIPASRQRYLAEISETVRTYHADCEAQTKLARQRQQLEAAKKHLLPDVPERLEEGIQHCEAKLTPAAKKSLERWHALQKDYRQSQYAFQVRDKTITVDLFVKSLAGLNIPRVALPRFEDDGERLRWMQKENVPGHFPYTAGVFPFKRQGEDPSRLFAGEGDPARTNRRFKLLSEGAPANRLSTAFDSVTLYGHDPAVQPDVYGKVGNSGVSIATLDDMNTLYEGFDLCHPKTSVSMTINGPAPIILALFFNTAIDQQVAKFQEDNQREPNATERENIKANALHAARGTVQADILKEDQAQNTCIFSIDFALKMMADIQAYFIENKVRNFYSVSISGYHIAEAGANPISQLAFTLANGFTYVEAYLARGMDIDAFAPSLSFFFSNGMDPEYSVMGRVARRIWAVALRDKYGANPLSQRLKYHVQTSGRSLHAQEMAFNDIRTTLEALIALYDNCNSLHTNAFDEAITTPTPESVRRALAIQLIINKEWGLSKNENPLQGSFIIDELTDLVEEAVLQEFERLSDRGGVLGAMETGYQRGKIQEESLLYEHLKHSGELPIIGVNTFLQPDMETPEVSELARSTEEEKQNQLSRLAAFQSRHDNETPAMLARLQDAVLNDENIFAVLMDAVRVCSLGQISNALFAVGGKYRRNM